MRDHLLLVGRLAAGPHLHEAFRRIGKNTFHLVGLDQRGVIAMRIKVSRNQLASPAALLVRADEVIA